MTDLRIDSHHHLWDDRSGFPEFLEDEQFVSIRRVFTAEDLEGLLAQHGFDGSVLVQAAESLEETHFMLGEAERCDAIKAVVGWVDTTDPEPVAVLEAWSEHPLFRGIRPWTEGEDLLAPDHTGAYEALVRLGLSLDLMASPGGIDAVRRLIHRHPGLMLILNHCGYPEVGDDDLKLWRAEMTALARETEAVVKLSGLTWGLPQHWRNDILFRVFDHLLDTFGPQRLMWGSDWPHLEAHDTYAAWTALTKDYLARLSDDEQGAIFGGTAVRAYRIG